MIAETLPMEVGGTAAIIMEIAPNCGSICEERKGKPSIEYVGKKNKPKRGHLL